jgi:hypothetical protein
MRRHVLETREPRYMPLQLSLFISMAHDPQRVMGHVLAPEPTTEAVRSGAE